MSDNSEDGTTSGGSVQTRLDAQVPNLNSSDWQDAAVQTANEQVNSAETEVTQSEAIVSSSEQRQTATIRRHEELWFDDGDLIVLASDVEFRVYKEPLVKHSRVLLDTIQREEASGSQNPSDDSSCVTTIRLSDSPEDLQLFLSGFFSGSSLRVGHLHPTFHEVSAHIRLGRKYGIDRMVHASLEYLKIHFPDTGDCEAWDHAEILYPPEFELIQAIGVVNLARLTARDSLLPAAFISCSKLGKTLLRGFTRLDGTRETLTPDDLKRVMDGRVALSRVCASAAHRVFKPVVADDCTRRDVCLPVLESFVPKLSDQEDALFNITFRDPSRWTQFVEDHDTERRLCSRCFAMIGRWSSGRQAEEAVRFYSSLWNIWDLKRREEVPNKDEPKDTSTQNVISDSQHRSLGVQTDGRHRDEELWFESGNITLIARDVEFRVWKAPLVKHSPVFRDMLSLPQPGASTPDDKIPVSGQESVVCLPDSPEDLRHFLRVFFPGKKLRIARPNPTYHEISAQIRLGHKYQIEQMVQRNLKHLQKYYAEDCSSWFDVSPLEPPGFLEEQVIGVVNLARLTGTDSILPTAILGCSCLYSDTLLKGMTLEDGSHETLCPDDIGRCLSSKWETTEASVWLLHKVFSVGPADDCIRPPQCRPIIQKMLDGVMSDKKDAVKLMWWEDWRPYMEEVDEDRELCKGCFDMLHSRKCEEHRKLFDRLPDRLELKEATSI